MNSPAVTSSFSELSRSAVAPFERAGEGYAAQVDEWLANPHATFKAFGPEARDFQRRNRSERLRTMTLVAPAEELAPMRPLKLGLDRSVEAVDSWTAVFAIAAARLISANPETFAALQKAGALEWMGCPSGGPAVGSVLAEGGLRPSFADLASVVRRVQWMFLMCGIRLNEVIVQVDPFTDESWSVRKAAIDRRRAEDRAFLEGRRAAQKAWAEAHPEDSKPLF